MPSLRSSAALLLLACLASAAGLSAQERPTLSSPRIAVRQEPTFAMPRVMDMHLSEARRVLGERGLVLARVDEVDSGAPEGTVLRQLPAPGAPVRRGDSAMVVVVRSKPEPPRPPDPDRAEPPPPPRVDSATVPRVRDVTLARARAALERTGLAGEVLDPRLADSAAWIVDGQEPMEGARLPVGSPVRLLLRAPPRPVAPPVDETPLPAPEDTAPVQPEPREPVVEAGEDSAPQRPAPDTQRATLPTVPGTPFVQDQEPPPPPPRRWPWVLAVALALLGGGALALRQRWGSRPTPDSTAPATPATPPAPTVRVVPRADPGAQTITLAPGARELLGRDEVRVRLRTGPGQHAVRADEPLTPVPEVEDA